MHESREFQSQRIDQHATDYLALKKLIGEGGDLTPYLSRDVQRGRADENDKTLNAWGLHHLHFRPGGTRDVLFARITDSAVFVVKFLPQGSQHRDTWVDLSLLRILHDNWPEAGSRKLRGIMPESITSDQRIALRKNNVNFAGNAGSVTAKSGIRERQKGIVPLELWQKVQVQLESNLTTR